MRLHPSLLFLLLTPALVTAAHVTAARADAPEDAAPITLDAALDCVAARYRGEPLKVEAEEDGRLAEVRWLTPAGNVLKLTLAGPGCRFLEVEGTGQTAARILP